MEGLRGSRRIAIAMELMTMMVIFFMEKVCHLQCLKNESRLAQALLGPVDHCNFGCISSACSDSHIADAKAMRGCITSCSDSCDKAYVPH
ncbi:hypothetical protein CDL15_Pgr003442 [Punica granatum]|uniref:Uncharacterized protein n=1 Tax=Punica granatum TaxID=22663 RepID=A0A218X3L1_PUNGR|nr:hypothetical protein CDL15_Pgr003442 [Punica granatum]